MGRPAHPGAASAKNQALGAPIRANPDDQGSCPCRAIACLHPGKTQFAKGANCAFPGCFFKVKFKFKVNVNVNVKFNV
ncbi:MAG: hypothetical protein IPL96_02965 [Holophagaceae bacterium]|nr:hypothetical protein [Holophagaceae bacterium]